MDILTAKQARQRVTKDARRRKPRKHRSIKRGRPVTFTAALEAHFKLDSKPLLVLRKRPGHYASKAKQARSKAVA